MYSVTAPAKSCAIPTDRSDTTGKPVQARRDFKVIGGAHSSAEFRKSLRKIDPGELASKILQLHAAAPEPDETGPEKPSMTAGTSDSPFEIPGVLRKSDDAEKIADVVNRSAQKKQRKQHRPAKLPRFRTLAAGVLFAGLAGGAALALGLPDMLIADEPATRPVSTERIVAEPPVASTAETTMTDGVSAISNPESAAATDPFNTATPQQIAEAKDRLRLAFASGNTGQPQTTASAGDGSGAPVYPQAPSDPSVLADAAPTTAVAVSTVAAGLSTPAYARQAPAETRSENTVPPDNDAVAANNSPDAVLNAAAAVPAVVEAEPAQDISAYPHSGTTTAAVNMRFSEKRNSEIIAVIPSNTTVSFNECGKWWCGVEYDGKTGFVGQRFVNRATQ
ncbi:MAG: hypothetical protein AAFN16_17140 [Pseudomonadota bacterium]